MSFDDSSSDRAADLALITRALDGDKPAIASVVERMRCVPRILHVKNARLGRPLSREDIADLAQDVLSTVWRKLDTFHGVAPLESWLYRFCTLTMMDMLKRRRVRPQPAVLDENSDGAPRHPGGLGGEVDGEAVRAALARLPGREEAVIRMKHYDDLTFQAIAERMGHAPSTVKSIYYRALSQLRAQLDGHLGVES